MTQPPFNPFDQPMRPVNLPQPGPQQPVGHLGQMRGVDQLTTTVVRPGVVVGAFALWLVAAAVWPVGTVVRVLAEEGGFAGFGPVMTLFTTGCLAVGGVCGAIAFFRGSHQARVALCVGYFVLGILAVAALVVAARDGDTGPAAWAVIVLRVATPAAAAVLSFLPGSRHYFAGSPG